MTSSAGYFRALALVGLLCTTGSGLALPLAPGVASAQAPAQVEELRLSPPGGWEAMEARLRAAIQLSPGLAAFHSSLGEALRAQGRITEARAAFAEAVRLEPDDPAFRDDLARAHLALEEWSEAEAHFGWAIRLDPAWPGLHAGLGEALYRQGRLSESAAAFTRAAELEPGDPALAERARQLRAAASAPEPTPSRAAPMARGMAGAFTVAAAVFLTLAAVGLILPVLAAIFLLFLLTPVELLRRRSRPTPAVAKETSST